ncbi:MAG TPA: HAD family hydrolase [Firmicutes bacterium]|nr:HAD family hydrolase [Bacillota bacterium]
MITTILFDLDGTLVHYEFDRFLTAYLEGAARKVQHLMNPQRFVKKLLAATEAMIHSTDGERTNMEVFWDHFAQGLDVPLEQLIPLLDEFYLQDYPKIREIIGVVPNPAARELVERLIRRGYEVVIATNPVFPAVAIHERMRWGGIEDLPYALITTYENSCFCKPNVQYYAEILEHLGRLPHQCLMVGNNTCEDMVAGDLGIKTYLVDSYLLEDGPFSREPDYRGSFDEMVEFLADEKFLTAAE